jgi:hypothetical protein
MTIPPSRPVGALFLILKDNLEVIDENWRIDMQSLGEVVIGDRTQIIS